MTSYHIHGAVQCPENPGRSRFLFYKSRKNPPVILPTWSFDPPKQVTPHMLERERLFTALQVKLHKPQFKCRGNYLKPSKITGQKQFKNPKLYFNFFLPLVRYEWLSHICATQRCCQNLFLLGIPGVAFFKFLEFAFIYLFFLGRKTHGANCWSYTESNTQPRMITIPPSVLSRVNLCGLRAALSMLRGGFH